jgi:hypothetical protein
MYMEKQITRRIAIIKERDLYARYYDGEGGGYDRQLIESITDWEEVSEADFQMLSRAGGRLGFVVIERPVDQPAFIAKSIADYKKLVKVEEDREAALKKAREAAALERKHKKEMKTRESKRELLEKLKKELGEQ